MVICASVRGQLVVVVVVLARALVIAPVFHSSYFIGTTNGVPRAPCTAAASGASDRDSLIASLFKALDTDKDGALSSSEALPFALFTGFDGLETEWATEHIEMCKDLGCDPRKGVSLAAFTVFVNDDSEQGCFTTEEEMKRLVDERNAAAAASATKRAESGTTGVRARLIARTFKALIGGGLLKQLPAVKMLPFARLVGFDGSEADWGQEFQNMCRDFGCDPSHGLDFPSFTRFVNDDSDKGCFCTDEELQQLVQQCAQEAKASTKDFGPDASTTTPGAHLQKTAVVSPSSASHTTSDHSARRLLVERTFKALLVNASQGNSALSASMMRRFAIATGYQGDEEAWTAEFPEICKDLGCDSSHGVTLEAFEAFVNDESEDGCYCEDQELARFIQEFRNLN